MADIYWAISIYHVLLEAFYISHYIESLQRLCETGVIPTIYRCEDGGMER